MLGLHSSYRMSSNVLLCIRLMILVDSNPLQVEISCIPSKMKIFHSPFFNNRSLLFSHIENISLQFRQFLFFYHQILLVDVFTFYNESCAQLKWIQDTAMHSRLLIQDLSLLKFDKIGT